MKSLSTITIFSLLFFNLYSQSVSKEFDNESFVALNGSAISSIGNIKKDWNKANALYLSYSVIYSNHWALVLQGGYIRFKQNSENNFSGDPKLTLIPLQVGGRYYFLLQAVRPYLLALSGINFITQKYTSESEVIDKTFIHQNFQIGFGIDFFLVDGLFFDLHANYNSHSLNPSAEYNITGLEYGVGIKWKLYGE